MGFMKYIWYALCIIIIGLEIYILPFLIVTDDMLGVLNVFCTVFLMLTFLTRGK